jgi:hypothetical protein
MINDNRLPSTTYKILQFGEPNHLTPEQLQSIAKEMQTRQQTMHAHMQNMLHDIDQLFAYNRHFMHHPFPYFMPVIVPVQASKSQEQSEKQVNQSKESQKIAKS